MPVIRVHDSYGAIDPTAWDSLVGPDGSPFLEHAFLFGLELLGCATEETGWVPRPITVHDDDGTLVAGAPGWVKSHSMGEFVYDHSWADAAVRARIPYYPKLIIAVPFTPVAGRRLLTSSPQWREPLLRGLEQAASGTHGLHILFDTAEEAHWLSDRGGFSRTQFQFHWKNEDYGCFEDFLGCFKSKVRNKIRRERRDTRSLRIEAMLNPDDRRLNALHGFYRNTCRNFGPWGRVYLSEDFFHYLAEHWRDRLQSVIAWDGDRPVGGTLNVEKAGRLYGRYWGCTEEVKFLHFELCYYQAIDWCIDRKLDVFEPGHGGGHKYKRGFEPVITYSNHWLADPRLHQALAHHVRDERMHVEDHVAVLNQQSRLRTPEESPD